MEKTNDSGLQANSEGFKARQQIVKRMETFRFDGGELGGLFTVSQQVGHCHDQSIVETTPF
jgi:hypothetical protein